MYCLKLNQTIDISKCHNLQDNECSNCEYFEPFIWFMMNQQEQQLDNCFDANKLLKRE